MLFRGSAATTRAHQEKAIRRRKSGRNRLQADRHRGRTGQAGREDFTSLVCQVVRRKSAESAALCAGQGRQSCPVDSPRFLCKPVEKPLSPKEQLYKILCSYRSLLVNWRMAYAPKNPEVSLHPCFVASLHYADRVQYLLDILLQESPNEKQQLLNGKEVTALGEAIERCKETEDAA